MVNGSDLASAVAQPRWRSEAGRLLISRQHPGFSRLAELGHKLRIAADGDVRFGAVVSAGLAQDMPVTLADWRRDCWAGIA